MARNRNRGLQKTSGKQEIQPTESEEQSDAITPEVVFPPANVPLINAQIVQILIQNNNPDEVRRLMQTDLEYNQKRLAIIREHAQEHPDAIEMRKTRGAHRYQYAALLAICCGLLVAMPFAPLAVSGVFGIIAILIICGILVNARERELDLQGFINLINIIVRGQK